MNPIPLSWCLVGAGIAAMFGALSSWVVCDWRHDSKTLAAVEKAAKDLDQARSTVDRAATAYEQEKPVADAQSTVRESTIREIYKDRPVNVDCAAPVAAVGVLNDAVAAANARAAGQLAPGLNGPAGGTGAADRTGP